MCLIMGAQSIHTDKPKQCVEKQRHYSTDKVPYSEGYGLPSGHIQLWELDLKEGQMPKNWCLRTVMLEKTPESSLDGKIKSVHLKGYQPWIFVGRTDAEAEAPILWPPDANICGHLIPRADSLEKSLMLGKIEGRRRGHQRMRWMDGITDAMDMNLGKLWEMVRDREAWVCCSPWGCEEWDKTGKREQQQQW